MAASLSLLDQCTSAFVCVRESLLVCVCVCVCVERGRGGRIEGMTADECFVWRELRPSTE